MKRKIYKWIFCRVMGWKIIGTIDGNLLQCVMIVVPHTSWSDFFIGLFARGVIGLQMHWVGKKELFKFPLSYYFRWMGGEPLDRSGGKNTVDAIVEIFQKKEVFRMAIAPEGTRKKVTEWKTGFYYIALKAGVPIIPVAFDYGIKEVNIAPAFYPTGDINNDFTALEQHFIGVKGKFPEKSFL